MKPELRKISQNVLEFIMEEHKLWLSDPYYAGEKANFRYTDLVGINFGDYDLSTVSFAYADLTNANFYGAILEDANFDYANLTNANFAHANLTSASMVGTILNDTNFRATHTSFISGTRFYSIDNIGTFRGKVTYVPIMDRVFAGCWEGTLEEFLTKGLEMNRSNPLQCENIRMAYRFFLNNQRALSQL
jgi:uncharacterized protein YjbI with pentapeptide repeats